MSSGPPPAQTRSFLMKRFAEIGFRPHTKFGQNFLIDLNLQDLLLRTAQLDENDVVLEVGTGTGSLTIQMAQQAAAVITVEIDPMLHQLATEELNGCDNVTMLREDVLRNKNRLNPRVMSQVSEKLAESPQRRFKLAANLPYSIATPLISNLLAEANPPAEMIVTIQKELADRIVAVPATKDYGALSVWMQSQCHVELVRVMPPTVFWPQPKVSSAIIHVVLDPARRARIADIEFFHDFARAMFFHRRKFLRSVVLSAFKGRLDKPQVDELFGQMGFAANTRAEELDVDTILAFSDCVRAKVGGGRLL